MATTRPARRRAFALAVAVFMLAGVLPPLGIPTPAAAVVLAAPTLTSPGSSATVTGNPSSPGAPCRGEKYRIQVSQSPSFASTVVADETLTLRYTPPAEATTRPALLARRSARRLQYVGDVCDRIAHQDLGRVSKPLVAPADGTTLNFPTDPLLFAWDALAGAQSYELQVDDALDFIGAAAYTTKNTSYVITEPKTSGQTFDRRVRGVSGGTLSDWSVPRRFDVQWPGVPALVYPADGAILTDLYLDWSPVAGAKTYQLQVSPNGDWANRTIDVVVKSTRYAPPTTLNNGNYFWRVRAQDAASTPNNGGWSAEHRFQRKWAPRPTLLAPADGDGAVEVPTFAWAPVDHAAYYELQWSVDPNFLEENIRQPNGDKCFTNHTTVTPYDRL